MIIALVMTIALVMASPQAGALHAAAPTLASAVLPAAATQPPAAAQPVAPVAPAPPLAPGLPSLAAAAPSRQVLTQANEFELETKYLNDLAKENDRSNRSKLTSELLGLGWPLVALVAIVLFRRTIETIALTRKWSVAIPGGLNLSVTDQLTSIPSAAASDSAVADLSAITISSSASAHPGSLAASLGAADPKVQNAAMNLEVYFQRAASKILATQLMLIRALLVGPQSRNDAYAIYASGVARGLPLTFDQWIAYLTGYKFLEVKNALLGQTYAITDLGKHFATWCDTHGVTEASLVSQGRGA